MSWGNHAAASSTAPTPRGERTRAARFRSAPAEPARRLTTRPAHPRRRSIPVAAAGGHSDRKSTRLNSSHLGISYAVFCLKKKTQKTHTDDNKAEQHTHK